MAVRTSFTSGEVLTAADLTDTFGSKLNLAGGKILQIVRATDVTQRSTTNGSFVDASISVTITPQKNDSAIIVLWTCRAQVGAGSTATRASFQITDASNNALSGSESTLLGNNSTTISDFFHLALIGYSTPATTSATTYKGRFSTESTNGVAIQNQASTGQLFAIEVSA
jgi:hypothetical protein